MAEIIVNLALTPLSLSSMIPFMSLKFGTSGVRGLATEFTSSECLGYVSAFVSVLKLKTAPLQIFVAGDLRDSTPSIKERIILSIQAHGILVLDGGIGPTPALAWACNQLNVPGIMVTGSHIPGDRNGLKFYFPQGEILKEDESKISKAYAEFKEGAVILAASVDHQRLKAYDMNTLFKKRYLDAFVNAPLKGLKIGFYQHSSVARDLYPDLLRQLGAGVHEFARSASFQAVDTEAVENIEFMDEVIQKEELDLVVSTDGDSDRPLVVSNLGKVIPGELLGLITSEILGIDTIVYPVSCSSTVSESKLVRNHLITKIGSPFVLGGMLETKLAKPDEKIAGFEANGGYLLGSEAHGLQPLMTRDSLLPILGLLLAMKAKGFFKPSELLQHYAGRVNLSGLIKDFPLERAAQVLKRFRAETTLMGLKPIHMNELDGSRVTLEDQSIVHLRPSGNAPEFRIYIEAANEQKAEKMLQYFKAWVESA